MPFPENVKDEARRKAHFRCVICHEPFVDIHHIIRESEGGADTLDNAAALCARCHDTYGNNPDKRKQIRGMRDLWYDICATRYRDSDINNLQRLNELYEMTKSVQQDQAEHGKLINEIKALLTSTLSQSVANIGSSASVFEMANATSGYFVSGKKLSENVYADVHCPNCKSYIALLLGTNKCPTCGKPIR